MSQIKHLFYQGDSLDVLQKLPDQSVHCCVTSPPYWNLRDYGVDGQIGLEKTPEEYVTKMVEVFREVKRVLRDDGTLWLNLGDSYANNAQAGDKVFGNPEFNKNRPSRQSTKTVKKVVPIGLKPKDLVGIPWMVAFALRADGWYLRSDVIWSKPNPLPESVTDRPTKAHEYLFLLAKSGRYYYDAEAIKEPASWDRWGDQTERKTHPGTAGHLGGKKFSELPIKTTKNKRTVWTIATQPYPEAHFATFPPSLVEPCILAGTSEKACPKCGAPWERVVERMPATSKECPKTQAAHEARGGVGKPVGTVGKSGGGRINGHTKTLGFQPTCSCPNNDGSGACIVLDPFGGSGTVSLVAKRLGRGSVYIDLNPEYLQMALKRMGNQEMLFEQHRIEVR